MQKGLKIAAHVGLHGPSRPKSGAAVDWAPIDEDGSFQIRASPGSNYVYVMGFTKNFDLPSAAWVKVEVADGETIEVELKVTPTN